MSALLQRTHLILLSLLLLLLGGCQQIQTIEHQIQVEAADTGAPVSGATVRAEMGVRDFVETVTNEEGLARLSIKEKYLNRWAKVIVDADGYRRQSQLVELLENSPTTVVQLTAADAETSTQPPAGEQAVALTEPTIEVPAATPVTLEPNEPQVEIQRDAQVSADAIIANHTPSTPPPLADVSPAQRADYYQALPEMNLDPTRNYRAVIQTNKGNILVTLNAREAPEHVNNFIFLSRQGFYDGLTFHRVDPGFVIQGGDPLGSGQGGPGYTIPGEFDLTHGEGALAMARLPDQVNPERESSGSQFYITLASTPFLDGQYSVFGKVEEGMDVVQSIEVGDKIERIIIAEE